MECSARWWSAVSSDAVVTPADVQATFCATLVDEWVHHGVGHAVIAPGSRSTPMALALARRDEITVHLVHDERAAAFVALGLGLGDVPAVLLCTSGTAAANFHPAVVEAGLSDIPMLVVTADRPPELRDVGAPQTIDQASLYGRSVRWFHDPGIADAVASGSWRSLGWRCIVAASTGPVHLNLPFREPFLGEIGELPIAPRVPVEHLQSTVIEAERVAELLGAERGVILAGGRSGVPTDDVAVLSKATGWPVLADPPSGCRQLVGAVTAFDAMLRVEEFAESHRPDVVLRVGRPAASRVLSTWVATSGATVVQIGGPGVIDPDHRVAAALPATSIGALAALAAPRVGRSDWLSSWTDHASLAERAIANLLSAESALSEPGVARCVAEHLPDGAELVVASSMPVRDLEWFGGPNARAHANRGANGIDGVVSTALGVALGGATTVALVGDIAFLHDAGALTALRHRQADLRIVVIDNDGGGIFSFLPQAAALAAESFELLFGTPHGTDLVAVAGAHHLDADTVTTADELAQRLAAAGPWVTRVATDRAANVALHDTLNRAVAEAITDG
jgi:2-succinyl-5-enolpyruvyl-6-hydroxy-3-cyclohexene-1-carboxylate synthase